MPVAEVEELPITTHAPVEFSDMHPSTVIDIGSNSGRAVVIQPRPGGHLEVLEELRVPLRLGAALDEQGRLSDAAWERTVVAVEEFLAISRAAGAEQVIAVGTSALRRATNGPELVREIRSRFGLEISVIDGEREGHYSFLGALHGLPVSDGMLIDIGGGSVELAHFTSRRIEDSWSFPLGTLQASERYLEGDPPTEESLTVLREATRAALREAGVPRLRASELMVGTGGAVRNVAKVDRRRRRRQYPISRVHGYELRRRRLRKVASLLATVTAGERTNVPGLNPARTETIVAGVTVLDTVMDELRGGRLLVSGQGLREGVLRGSLGRALPPTDVVMVLPPPASVRRASIRALLARFSGWNERRSRRRGWTALELLQRSGAVVDEELLELVGYAALVVETGTAIDFYNREDVAAEIVMRTDLAGFSHSMIARLAALIRLIEGPKFDVRRFEPLLAARDQASLELAAAALALADEVHRRVPEAAADGVWVQAGEHEIRLQVPVRAGNPSAEVMERAERAFGCPVRVVHALTVGR